MNRIVLLAIAIALASVAPKGFAQSDEKRTPTRPFIEETRIVAPQRIGDFELEGSRFDPENKFAGASFRYRHPDHRAVRIDLFVYPVGETETEQTLDMGMRDFRASMKPAIDAGYYRDVVEGETVEFDIDTGRAGGAPAASGTGTDAAPADPQSAKRQAMAEGLLDAGQRIDGRRMSLRYGFSDDVDPTVHPMRSRTYLFYRQLHYFKGRISAAESQIDEATYAELADRAMRALVPAVQAYNIGACADTTVYVNTDAPKQEAGDQLVRAILQSTIRNTVNNCHGKADEAAFSKLSEGAAVETIRYTAADWGGP